jgi:DNA-binding response OmpR family regulator
MRLLVVEDTPDIAHVVRFALSEEGYAVDVAHTATDGLLAAQTQEYDGIVLDVLLPDRNGVEVVRQLRREGRATPVLMLTAQRETSDVIRGLDAGADDYLAKPFSVDELKARVRALTRRGGAARTEQVACGNVVLNRTTKQVLVAGQRTTLTPKEYALLEHLVLHADEVVTRTQVLERVWERDRDPDSNVIDALVARLRAKLKELGATARIETVRGFGFMLTADGAAANG